MTRPINAPACYGAASVFSHDSEVCRQCPAFAECANAALETLEAIKGVIDVGDLLKRHARARKESQKNIRVADEEAAAKMPPGNSERPLLSSAERKTTMAKVEFVPSRDEERALALISSSKTKDSVAIPLCKMGLIEHIKKDLKEGRNTLDQSGVRVSHFVRLTLDMLLAGGFTRADMRDKFMTELSWGEGTANAYVSMVCATLIAFRIAVVDSCKRIVVSPALRS